MGYRIQPRNRWRQARPNRAPETPDPLRRDARVREAGPTAPGSDSPDARKRHYPDAKNKHVRIRNADSASRARSGWTRHPRAKYEPFHRARLRGHIRHRSNQKRTFRTQPPRRPPDVLTREDENR